MSPNEFMPKSLQVSKKCKSIGQKFNIKLLIARQGFFKDQEAKLWLLLDFPTENNSVKDLILPKIPRNKQNLFLKIPIYWNWADLIKKVKIVFVRLHRRKSD